MKTRSERVWGWVSGIMQALLAIILLTVCAIVITTGIGLLCSLVWHFFRIGWDYISH